MADKREHRPPETRTAERWADQLRTEPGGAVWVQIIHQSDPTVIVRTFGLKHSTYSATKIAECVEECCETAEWIIHEHGICHRCEASIMGDGTTFAEYNADRALVQEFEVCQACREDITGVRRD